MNRKKLNAAVKRLRRAKLTEFGSCENPYTDSDFRLDEDLWIVADAYLALREEEDAGVKRAERNRLPHTTRKDHAETNR